MSLVYGPGFYTGKITTWKIGQSKEKGTPCIEFWIAITGHKHLGKVEPCPANERPVVKYITENTIEYVARDLKKLGYSYDTFDQLDPSHPQAFDFEGVEVEVQCKHEQYKGKDHEKWDFALMEQVYSKPIEKNEISKLNALFGSKLKQAGSGNGTPPPLKRAPEKSTAEQAEEVF